GSAIASRRSERATSGSEQGGDNATPDDLQSPDSHHRLRRATESVTGHGGRMDAADKRHDRARDAGLSDGRPRGAQGWRWSGGERIAGHGHRDLHQWDDTRLVPGTAPGLPYALPCAAAVAEP